MDILDEDNMLLQTQIGSTNGINDTADGQEELVEVCDVEVQTVDVFEPSQTYEQQLNSVISRLTYSDMV